VRGPAALDADAELRIDVVADVEAGGRTELEVRAEIAGGFGDAPVDANRPAGSVSSRNSHDQPDDSQQQRELAQHAVPPPCPGAAPIRPGSTALGARESTSLCARAIARVPRGRRAAIGMPTAQGGS